MGTDRKQTSYCWRIVVGFLVALVLLLLAFLATKPLIDVLFNSCGNECDLLLLTQKLCAGKRHCGIVGTEVRLGGVKLSPDSARKLAIAVADNETVTALRLWETDIGNAGVGFICDSVALHEGIQTMQLAGNGLDDGACQKISEMLKKNEVLRYLDLNDNAIANEGAERLAEGLALNNVLLTLNLWHNKIGERGAMAFADSFKQNDILQELILSDNAIDDGGVGAQHLREAELASVGVDISWEHDD